MRIAPPPARSLWVMINEIWYKSPGAGAPKGECEMAKIQRIGILTSGGDCAGLNAVIRAAAFRAIAGYGWEAIGIHQGTRGLLARPVEAEALVRAVRGRVACSWRPAPSAFAIWCPGRCDRCCIDSPSVRPAVRSCRRRLAAS